MERESICCFEGDGQGIREWYSGDHVECGRSFKVIADFGDEHSLHEQEVSECDCEDQGEDRDECHRGGLHGSVRQSESVREKSSARGRDLEGFWCGRVAALPFEL